MIHKGIVDAIYSKMAERDQMHVARLKALDASIAVSKRLDWWRHAITGCVFGSQLVTPATLTGWMFLRMLAVTVGVGIVLSLAHRWWGYWEIERIDRDYPAPDPSTPSDIARVNTAGGTEKKP